MGEATNSSSGRATRLPVSSGSRRTTFYDRLEEARLRRQVALAAKNPPVSSNSAAKPEVSRSFSSVVEPVAEIDETQEEICTAAKQSLDLPADVAEDTDVPEIAPYDAGDETTVAPWRLVGPGVAAGFVFAMIVVVWGEAQIVSLTSRAVLAAVPLSQAGLPTSRNSISPAAALGPVAVPEGPTLANVPAAESSARPLQPVPVVLATLEPTPVIFSTPPKPASAAPFVLSKIPPARPSNLNPDTPQMPTFAGLEIVLHIPNGARASDSEGLLTAASGAGFEIAATRPAAFEISRTNVRYFHAGDAQAARALAQAIGGRFRDFTNFTPPPEPGVIEIWLKGQGSPARTN